LETGAKVDIGTQGKVTEGRGNCKMRRQIFVLFTKYILLRHSNKRRSSRRKYSTNVGDANCVQNVVGKPEDKRLVGKLIRIGERVDNIKVDLTETE
jgi:hypothetical protein